MKLNYPISKETNQSTQEMINSLLEEQKSFLQNNDLKALSRILFLFSDDLDFFIPGNEKTVSWIGRKKGIAGVSHFYEELKNQAKPQIFEIYFSVIEGEKAVLVGQLQTLIKNTGKSIKSEFAIVFKVENTKIKYFRLYEDSWAVSKAVKKREKQK